MELPSVPRLFSFIVAPAIFPPTAPLTASMIRLMRFILLVLGLSALGFVRASADMTRRDALVVEKLPSVPIAVCKRNQTFGLQRLPFRADGQENSYGLGDPTALAV